MGHGGAVMVTRQQDKLGKWNKPERTRIRTSGALQMAAQEGGTISVNWVCAGVRNVIRGEVREPGSRWYVQSILGCITSGTVGRGIGIRLVRNVSGEHGPGSFPVN